MFFKGCRFKNTIVDGYSVIVPRYLMFIYLMKYNLQ